VAVLVGRDTGVGRGDAVTVGVASGVGAMRQA